MTRGDGALLKVTSGRSPVSAWTFGAATRDVRIRIGSSQEATWRFLDPDVAPLHFEMFWDGSTLWLAAPYEAEVRVNGQPIREWTPLQGRFRIEFGGAAVDGLAPEGDTTNHDLSFGAWRRTEAAPPVHTSDSAPRGFQAASGPPPSDLDTQDELPGEPTVYLQGRQPKPSPKEDEGWEDEPTRAAPLPDMEEDRPTAVPSQPASASEALRSEATVFAPLPEPPRAPAAPPSHVRPASSSAAPLPATPPPSSVQLAPELASPQPQAPDAPPREPSTGGPPPPTFVLPPEPTRKGFFARLFRPTPKVHEPTPSEHSEEPAPRPKNLRAYLEQGPELFGARPKVWLPSLLVLLVAAVMVTTSAARRSARRSSPPSASESTKTAEGPAQGTTASKRDESPRHASPPSQHEPGTPAERPAPRAEVQAPSTPPSPSEGDTAPAYSPKQAVEWLATGRLRMALAAYEALRDAYPDVSAFAEAARILSREVETLCTPPLRNPSACAPPPAPEAAP